MSSPRWRGIWNCPTQRDPLLAFECPMAWDALADTGDPSIRHCDDCQRAVHLCQTPQEFVRAGEQGHCVAIRRELYPIGLLAHQVGQPSPESVAAFRDEMAQRVGWWNAVIERLPQALGVDVEKMRGLVAGRKEISELGTEVDQPRDGRVSPTDGDA
jgi:hypothetical protein